MKTRRNSLKVWLLLLANVVALQAFAQGYDARVNILEPFDPNALFDTGLPHEQITWQIKYHYEFTFSNINAGQHFPYYGIVSLKPTYTCADGTQVPFTPAEFKLLVSQPVTDNKNEPWLNTTGFALYEQSNEGYTTEVLHPVTFENNWHTDAQGWLVFPDEVLLGRLQAPLKITRWLGGIDPKPAANLPYTYAQNIWASNQALPNQPPNDTLKLQHGHVGYNQLVSIEFSPAPWYANMLPSAMYSAANFFEEATDGQFTVDTIQFVTNKKDWKNADVQLYASNMQWPSVFMLGKGTMYMPRYFWGNNTAQRALSPYATQYQYNAPVHYQTWAHEWGHLLLNVYDEYINPFGYDMPHKDISDKTFFGMMDGQAADEHWDGGVPANELSSKTVYDNYPFTLIFGTKHAYYHDDRSVWESIEHDIESNWRTGITIPEERDPSQLTDGLYFKGYVDDVPVVTLMDQPEQPHSTKNVNFWYDGPNGTKYSGSYTRTTLVKSSHRLDQGQASELGDVLVLGVENGDRVSGLYRAPRAFYTLAGSAILDADPVAVEPIKLSPLAINFNPLRTAQGASPYLLATNQWTYQGGDITMQWATNQPQQVFNALTTGQQTIGGTDGFTVAAPTAPALFAASGTDANGTTFEAVGHLQHTTVEALQRQAGPTPFIDVTPVDMPAAANIAYGYSVFAPLTKGLPDSIDMVSEQLHVAATEPLLATIRSTVSPVYSYASTQLQQAVLYQWQAAGQYWQASERCLPFSPTDSTHAATVQANGTYLVGVLPQHPLLDNTQVTAALHLEAAATITAQNFSTEANSHTVLAAPQKVLLQPGTTLHQGSTVTAYIATCEVRHDIALPHTLSQNRLASIEALATSNTAQQQITVYPNPSNGAFTLRLGAGQGPVKSMAIYTLQGIKVWQQQPDNTLQAAENGLAVNASQLPAGTYLLVVQTANSGRLAKRVLIK